MTSAAIPPAAGIGLRHPHDTLLATEAPDSALATAWVEVHSENYLCDGGARRALLDDVRSRYPLSCHGVGLSLGSADGLDETHLRNLRQLFDRFRPGLISEHLSWSVTGGTYLNDLLPLPYTEESLGVMVRNVGRVQDVFGQQILVENPSRYLDFRTTTMSEAEFLNQLVEQTGCGLLLDINNIYVSCANTDSGAHAAEEFIHAMPADAIGEIHLAGHSVSGSDDDRVLIDTHSTRVCDEVWALYRFALDLIGPRPTLIEWDLDLPEFTVLQAEAATAQAWLDQAGAKRPPARHNVA